MIRVTKCSIKSIVKNDQIYNRINEVVYRCNEITTLAYQFIKLIILQKNKDGTKIPKIDRAFISTIFGIITVNDTDRGRVVERDSQFIELETFYKKVFSKLVDNYKPSKTNLSNILSGYSAKEMATNYKNNIQMHFVQRVKKVINESLIKYFEKNNIDLLESDKNKYEKDKKDALKQINIIKNSVLGFDVCIDLKDPFTVEVLKDDDIQELIKVLKSKLLPSIKKHIYYDIKEDPFKFIPHMIYINNKLEKLESTTNNMFPLNHNFVPKNISLDTACIVDILADKKVAYYRSNINKLEKKIWRKFFKTKLTKLYKKSTSKYVFNNIIVTDGYSVSISEATPEYIQAKKTKYIKKSEEEKALNKENTKKVAEIEKLNEIKYISDIKKEELEKLKVNNYKLIGIDPGKRNLLQFIDKNGKTLAYTFSQKRFESKITLSIQKRKKILENDIIVKNKIEDFTLSGKTTNIKDFKEYIKERYKLSKSILDHYKQTDYRKYNWHTFINTKKSESNLIKRIKETYGENIIIGIGDWCQEKQIKNFVPTKGIGLRRLLEKHFKVYLVDESFTSKVCHECKHETEYFKKVVEKDTFKLNKRFVHGLLVCKNKNCSKLWNRDTNGAKNIQLILKTHINGLKRPAGYCLKTRGLVNSSHQNDKTKHALLQRKQL